MRDDLISNWQDYCSTSAWMRVFDACCCSNNVRSWNKGVQLGGLFMSPVRFLDGNWPFLNAGFDGFELIIAWSARLRPSTNIPGCYLSEACRLLFIMVASVVQKSASNVFEDICQVARFSVV